MQTILNSPWNWEFQRSQREAIQARSEQRFSGKTRCHGTAAASPNSPQRPEAAGQGSSTQRTPDPSLGHLGLYTAAHTQGAGLQRPGSWSPAGHKGDGGTGSGKVRLLPEHKGAGGTCLTLTGALERARTWKFWVSFSIKAEVFTQRAYFCSAETEMTRSLRMQMLRDLKQEQLKRSLPRKENLLLLHSYQSSTVPKEQDRKSFLWSGIRKCH